MNNEKLIKLPKQVEEITSQLETIAFNFDDFEGVSDDEKLEKVAGIPVGSTLNFTPNKVYNFNKTLIMKTGMIIKGNNSTLNFNCSEDMKCLQVVDDCNVIDITVNQIGSNVAGGDNGDKRSPIVIGDYNSGVGYKNINIKNVSLTGNRVNGNLLTIIGGCENINVENVIIPYSNVTGRAILVHWGGFEEEVTTHPNNINFKNIRIKGVKGGSGENNAGIFLSGCHNINVDNVTIDDCMNGIFVYPGDRGYKDADEEIKPLAMKNINISNVIIKKYTNKGIRFEGKEYTNTNKFNYNTFSTLNRATIIGNGAKSYGAISFVNINNIDVSNCDISNTKYGITFEDNSNYINVSKCNISLVKDSVGYAINCDRSHNITIEKIKTVDTGGNNSGIRALLSHNTTIKNCFVSGYIQPLWLIGTNPPEQKLYNSVVISNEIVGNANSTMGIYLSASNNSTIKNNRVTMCQKGILVGENCYNVNVLENEIYNNSDNGVQLGITNIANLSANVYIERNRIYNNATGITSYQYDNVYINSNILGVEGETIQDFALVVNIDRYGYTICNNILLGSKNNNTFNLGNYLMERTYNKVDGNKYFPDAISPSLNYISGLTSSQGNSIRFGSEIPTSVKIRYKTGDIIINTNTGIGQPFGWQCITGGVPGVWKSISIIN